MNKFLKSLQITHMFLLKKLFKIMKIKIIKYVVIQIHYLLTDDQAFGDKLVANSIQNCEG